MSENKRIKQDTGEKESRRVVVYGDRKYLDKVLPVRLPSEKLEKIKQEARELGTSPSALARIWILDSLRKLDGNGRKEDG
jgi:hypothetical protein